MVLKATGRGKLASEKRTLLDEIAARRDREDFAFVELWADELLEAARMLVKIAPHTDEALALTEEWDP